MIPGVDTEDLLAIGYLCDWWRLHPQAWADTNVIEQMYERRTQTWHEVNAATEGALAVLLDNPHSMHWVLVYGLAVALHLQDQS